MTSTAIESNEYSSKPVPTSALVSGWQVALVKLGAVVALPGFVIGAQVGNTLGLKLGAISILIGGVVLMSIASLTGAVGAKSRLPTSLITQFAFGRLGGRFVNAILASTLLGWFGVTAEIFARGVEGTLASLGILPWPVQTYAILGGVLMVATTAYGFSALRRLSDVTIPLLLIVLLLAAHRSLQSSSLTELVAHSGSSENLGLGVSAVIGGLAASICVFPDLCRFARSGGHALVASGLTYTVGLPTVLILSAIIGVQTGSQDLIAMMVTLGLGVPALLLLIFKAWTTNSANLYSASLGLTSIFRDTPRVMLVTGAGAAGTALAVFGITNFLIPFLLVLSVTIPPVAGIYVVDFFLIRRRSYAVEEMATLPAMSAQAFFAWLVAIGVAASAIRGVITLTGIPAADAIGTSAVIYLILAKCLFPIGHRSNRSETGYPND